MHNKNWNQEPKYDIKWLAIIILAVAVFSGFSKDAKAQYSFPPKDNITMDVTYAYGGGGTWKCPSLRKCYVEVLRYEARGADQYCRTITIKRDNKVVWWRKYQ